MRLAIALTALVLSTGAVFCHGQTTRFYSSNQIAAARSKYPLGLWGCIATNTLEYEDYALHWMLTQANEIRNKWKLDIPKPLAVEDVLFQLNATALGIYGSVGTKDGRFDWFFNQNRFMSFSDTWYASKSFLYKDDEMARLAKTKSSVTANEAVAIARNALYQLGYTEQQLQMRKKPEVNQYKLKESNGKAYPLPAFDITWRSQGKLRLVADNIEYSPLQMEVSGITRNVSKFNGWELARRYGGALPLAPLPPRYFEMLHLPPNFLETLPERTRALYGLPPLTTNTPAKSLED